MCKCIAFMIHKYSIVFTSWHRVHNVTSQLKITSWIYVRDHHCILNVAATECLVSGLTQDSCIFVTWLVIMVSTCWFLSNRICLHMIFSSHMMTWDTLCLSTAVLFMVSWKEPWAAHCHPNRPTVVLFYYISYGEASKVKWIAVDFASSKKHIQQKQCKCRSYFNSEPPHALNHLVLLPEAGECPGDIIHQTTTKKSKYHKMLGCSYCKLDHIVLCFSALASCLEFED